MASSSEKNKPGHYVGTEFDYGFCALAVSLEKYSVAGHTLGE